MIEIDVVHLGLVIIAAIVFGWLLGGATAIWLGYSKP